VPVIAKKRLIMARSWSVAEIIKQGRMLSETGG
jgi:hypothetical protein